MKLFREPSWENIERALRALQKKGYFTSLTPMCHCKMPIAASPRWTSADRMQSSAPLFRQLAPGDCSDCLLPKMPQDCWRQAVVLESVGYFFHLPEWDEAYFAWNGNATVIKRTFKDNSLIVNEAFAIEGLMVVEFEATTADARLAQRKLFAADGSFTLPRHYSGVY